MLSFDPPYAPHFDYKVFSKEKERFLGEENTIHTKEEIEEMVQNWKGKTPRILEEHTTKKNEKVYSIAYFGKLYYCYPDGYIR